MRRWGTAELPHHHKLNGDESKIKKLVARLPARHGSRRSQAR